MNPEFERVNTLPKILRHNYLKYGESVVAMRRKEFGIWSEYTWKDYYTHVKRFALGLLSLGFKRGDKLAIIGDNDPEWYWAEMAALAIRGVAFGIYVDCMPDEIRYYLEHSDARFVVAHDQEQVDKVLQLKSSIPDLKKVIYWDEKGLWNYRDEILASFEDIEKMGEECERRNPGIFEDILDKGNPEDIAIFCYTSGTTGLPKAAMLSHANIINTAKLWASADNVGEREDYFSYIPPAWVTEQFLGICMGLMKAWVVNFPEDPETAQKDLREIGPRRLFYGARLWEGVASLVQAKIAEATPLKRWAYNFALKNAGYPMARCKWERRKPTLLLRFFYFIMWLIVFRPLQNKLGLTNLKVGYTAGAAIAPQTMELFHAFGVNVKNLYGSTETGVVTIHPEGDIRFETVGKVIGGCDVKISEEGEILVKGPTVFAGYYKNEEETKKKFWNGYYRTGDAGYFDKDGHLIYWDRLSEILELSNGSKFSPQYIEVRLRFSPFIRDVMVIGGKERDFVTAIINIDYENVGKWAERNHLSYTTYVDLSQKIEVCGLIKQEIERINSSLPEDVRIRRFVNLHKEFDADEAELTRTRKLRRELLEKKYEKLIESMYDGKTSYRVETEVTYQDGRKGTMEAEVIINDLK